MSLRSSQLRAPGSKSPRRAVALATLATASAVLLSTAPAAAQPSPPSATSPVERIDQAIDNARKELGSTRQIADAAAVDAKAKNAAADAAKDDEALRAAAKESKAVAAATDQRADAAATADRILSRDPERLEIYPYLGQAIDNFAAANTNDYLNYEESGEIKTRETFGVVFQYPLFTTQADQALWVYGQTTHGVRSADVDCEANGNSPLCQNPDFLDDIAAAQLDPNKRALYILRRSSSLEASLGLRYEFWKLNDGNAALYVNVHRGFVAVDDDDDDAADINHFSVGARVREGRYRNSYLEIGTGKNDLFEENASDRIKIQARVVVKPKLTGRWGMFFAHIIADVDGSDGADSVQTYLGIAFCPWAAGGCPQTE
jgi:hypothetical protein